MGTVSAIASFQSLSMQSTRYNADSGKKQVFSYKSDMLTLSIDGVSMDKAMGMVYESAMAKLQAVVDDARAALGIPEGGALDTSPEATANRIADFALGAFETWRKNHDGISDEDARAQFSQFIGAAIQEGISQARGILSALSALNSDVEKNIDSTWEVIQQRLQDFVAGQDNKLAV